jgi:hypothetical protein
MTGSQPITTFIFNPSAQDLFNRAYAVNIGPPNQTTALQYGTLGVNPAPLRVRFEIEKNQYGGSPNHSKIDLYNLSIASRQSIKSGYLVQLLAGYNNLIKTIFTGNVFTAKSTRDGPDIITTLECLDGGSAITYATLDKSYPAGVTTVQILTDCAQAMAVTTSYQPVGIGAGIALGIPNNVYNSGFAATGPCKDTLDKILKPLNLEWSIQDGNLNIIPKTAFNGAAAQIISVDTGMIGVPSNNYNFTQFVSLLNPNIAPGSLVQLISENANLNAFYKVLRVKYEGDSHDSKWQISCECQQQPAGSVQALPTAQGMNYSTAVVSS